MSNLGFQTVYRLFNDMDDVICERAFLPEKDPLQSGVKTIETRSRLNDFDIIAFSISFENDYPHVLTILKGCGVPLRSGDRFDSMPLVLAGGVACFLNPEPLAPFMDCFFIGEAESILSEFFQVYHPKIKRRQILKSLAAQLPGIYVPSFYRTDWHKDKTIKSFSPVSDSPSKIHRVYIKDLAEISTTSVVVSPLTTFGQMFLIEVGRGCPHGCRFCTTGYVYRPYRFRGGPQLIASLEKGLSITDRIGLVGAAITDLPDLSSLCQKAVACKAQVSFSSFRADRLSPHLISLIGQSGSKTATIAPDAGSQRMRDVIKKGITEDDVLMAVDKLVSAGIPHLKLYFMIGLPTESGEDIIEIINLCRRIKQTFLGSSRKKGRMGSITVSINPFVPKPFTPFQWAAMDEGHVLQNKIQTIAQGLKKLPNVRMIAETPRQAFIQALLSRGDQKVSEILLQLCESGKNWAKILKETEIDVKFYAARERAADEILAWDHIDHGFSPSLLEREYKKALKTAP